LGDNFKVGHEMNSGRGFPGCDTVGNQRLEGLFALLVSRLEDIISLYRRVK